jgi:hypothetical protein
LPERDHAWFGIATGYPADLLPELCFKRPWIHPHASAPFYWPPLHDSEHD